MVMSTTVVVIAFQHERFRKTRIVHRSQRALRDIGPGDAGTEFGGIQCRPQCERNDGEAEQESSAHEDVEYFRSIGRVH